MDQLDAAREGVQPLLERLAGGVDADGVDAGRAPHRESLPDHVLGADQRRREHHVVGDQLRRAGPVAGLPALAHRRRDLGPALPAVRAVVEVGRRRAHAAEAERQLGLAPGQVLTHRLLVVEQRELGALADVEVRPRASRRRQPLVQSGEVGVLGALGHEAGAEPAVGELAGQPQHRR